MDRKPNVLIVDDMAVNLQLLGEMLRDAGYEIMVATNGPDALEAAKMSPMPEIVLLDIVMPGMDGYQVCRSLKADPRTSHIPVIFISGMGMAEQKVRGFREGAVDYITKPFQVDEVVARIRTHLQISRMAELSLEIEERKRSEAALRESEAALRRAQELAHVGSWSWNILSGTLEWSDEMYSIFGIDKSTFDGDQVRLTADAVHPDDKERIERWNQAAAALSNPPPMEFRIIRPDGSIRSVWGECGGFDLDPDGKPLVVRGIIQDITERKSTERALRTSEDMFRLIFDHAQDAISVLKLGEEGRTSRFVQVNEAACRRLGYTRNEFQNLSLKDVAAPDFMKRLPGLVSDLRRDGQILFEQEQVAKDGRRIPVEVSTVLFDLEGEPATLSIARDITERKRAEQEMARMERQLQHAQRLESIGRLAGGVAHDFNNMLLVIQGHAELALERAKPDDPLRRDLETIHAATRRSADLTRQLLAFARRETVVPRTLDLNATAESLLKMLHRLIGEGIQLEWRPQPDLWSIRIDPCQIDQILANLCMNARDAIDDVGHIRLATANRIVGPDDRLASHGIEPGSYVSLSVADDGCGMPPEVVARVFEPFFTTKTTGKGTGLGLATVYGAVKQNNGSIEVVSEPGKGSVFTIYLPRHDQPPAPDEIPAHRPAERQASETILVVEDDAAILGMTVTILELQGYQILSARNPTEALNLARNHAAPIDLLLTDVVMPEMNGRELRNRLCDLRPGLKHLFVSGHTADVIANRGVVDQGVHFLQKPFSIKELATKVRQVLDNEE